MTKTTKIIIGILTGVFIIGIAVAVLMYNKPHTNVAKSKASISLSAEAFIGDFESNENKANVKYLEKIIEVSGVIADLTKDKGKGIVTLKSNGTMGSILCHLSPEETQKFKKLHKGTPINIKGICTGYLMDVILIKCVIIES